VKVTPQIASIGLGCEDDQCVIVKGTSFSVQCSVNIFNPTWVGPNSGLLATLKDSQVNCQDTEVMFTMPASIAEKYLSVQIEVTNSSGLWTDPSPISLTPMIPQITSLGLGCNNNQCVWMEGTNFSAQCSVKIYSPTWSGPNNGLLATLTSSQVNCQNTSATFTIPPAILAGYQSINVEVINSSGLWSPPEAIKFQPLPTGEAP
jgi:hypothetical protein